MWSDTLMKGRNQFGRGPLSGHTEIPLMVLHDKDDTELALRQLRQTFGLHAAAYALNCVPIPGPKPWAQPSGLWNSANDAVAVSKSGQKKAAFGGAIKMCQALLLCYGTPCHRLDMSMSCEHFNQLRLLNFNWSPEEFKLLLLLHKRCRNKKGRRN